MTEAIQAFIASTIRPALNEHNGDVEFVSFDQTTGTVNVRYVGACAGCPSSSLATHDTIESMLKEEFPDSVNELNRVD